MIKKSLHLLLAKGCGRGRTLLAGGHVIIGDQDVVGERTQCRVSGTLVRSPWSRQGALHSFFYLYVHSSSSIMHIFTMYVIYVCNGTMYDFHNSTDIFVNPLFCPFCTQKAP